MNFKQFRLHHRSRRAKLRLVHYRRVFHGHSLSIRIFALRGGFYVSYRFEYLRSASDVSKKVNTCGVVPGGRVRRCAEVSGRCDEKKIGARDIRHKHGHVSSRDKTNATVNAAGQREVQTRDKGGQEIFSKAGRTYLKWKGSPVLPPHSARGRGNVTHKT